MSEGFWIAAYVLLGVIVVLSTVKIIELSYKHDMDYGSRREWELLSTGLNANLAAKAFLFMVLWLFWPLILLFGIAVCVYATGMVLFDYVLDALDWVKWKVKR